MRGGGEEEEDNEEDGEDSKQEKGEKQNLPDCPFCGKDFRYQNKVMFEFFTPQTKAYSRGGGIGA